MEEYEDDVKKPRRRLPPCFRCQNHLRGVHRTVLINAIDGHGRTFHKTCAEIVLEEEPTLWEKL